MSPVLFAVSVGGKRSKENVFGRHDQLGFGIDRGFSPLAHIGPTHENSGKAHLSKYEKPTQSASNAFFVATQFVRRHRKSSDVCATQHFPVHNNPPSD